MMSNINIKIKPQEYSREWWAERKHLIDAFVDGRRIVFHSRTGLRFYANEEVMAFDCDIDQYEIAPLKIPAPPEGKEWYLKDSCGTLTAELLEPHKGYRPLLKDEVVQRGDGCLGDLISGGRSWRTAQGGGTARNCYIMRTKRPLPVEPVEPIKELTVEQIQEKLGYKIKIVEAKK
jgi:hypothetical protein